MNSTNVATADVRFKVDSSSARSSREKHAKEPRSPRHSAGAGLKSRPIGAPELGPKTGLPKINAAVTDLGAVTTAALKNLAAANHPPYLFRFGGRPAWLEYADDGTPFVQALTEGHLRHELARTMQWGIVKDKKWVPVLPPMYVVRDILATPNLSLPILEAVVRVPVFGVDGSLQLTAGYHADSRNFYLPAPGFSVPTVPEEPSLAEITRARNLLTDELLLDFPFVSDADRAHAIALSLLFYVRNLIDGPTPLHLFEKPTPGTGATLLVNALTWPATGRPLPAMSEGGDEEETRKRITAMLRNGPEVILIDNVRRALDSGALAAAITSTVWEDRLLRFSQTARLSVRCAWVATGNNPVLSNEIARRTVRIRLDAKAERPWLDREYRHPNLPDWVTEHRSELVWAHLVLVQAWIAAGQPRGGKKLGMFEGWSEVMGGILEVAGISGFLGNLTDLYEESDAETEAFQEFVEHWHRSYKEQAVAASELLPEAQEHLDLGTGSAQSQTIRLGKLLAKNKDRRLGDLRLVRAAKYQGSAQWKLVSVPKY